MGKVDDVRALKATGDYPAAWFKGYTKMDGAALDALLARLAPQTTDHGVPDGLPVTSEGYPVTVQVVATKTITFQGRPRTFRRAELFRGETAWELWRSHRTLVAPKG